MKPRSKIQEIGQEASLFVSQEIWLHWIDGDLKIMGGQWKVHPV